MILISYLSNSAKYGGGAHSNGGNFTIIGSNFTSNNALINNGGAVVDNCTFYVKDCTFMSNMAGNNGGGFYIAGGANGTIISSNFTGNTAKYGGGIANNYKNYGSNTTIIDCNFINNHATSHGGGIFNNESYMGLSGNTMTGNTAGVLGNVIYNNGTMGILNLTYLDNSTKKVKNNTQVLLYTILTDDMGNPVTGQKISFYADRTLIGTVESIEGQANLTYTANRLGIIPITGEYYGHGSYDIKTKQGQLEITKRNIIVTIIVTENDDGSITITANATFEDDGSPVIDHPVEFFLDGKKVGTGRTDKNGIAKLTIPANKITTGPHAITAIVRGDSQSNDGTESIEFTKTNKNNNTTATTKNPTTNATMKKTGIPIIAILLTLLATISIITRKKTKI